MILGFIHGWVAAGWFLPAQQILRPCQGRFDGRSRSPGLRPAAIVGDPSGIVGRMLILLRAAPIVRPHGL